MARYLAQRILLAVVSIWAITTITFFIALAAPGDPALLRYGEKSSPQAVAAWRHSRGLDRPAIVRYGLYLEGIAHGELGKSYLTDEPVTAFLKRGLPYTAWLATLALALALTAGLCMGIAASLNAGSWLDRTLTAAILTGVGVPNFVLAPVLILVFALYLKWLPVAGGATLSEGASYIGDWAGWSYWVLPAIVLAARPTALIGRMTRASMLETLRQDYIRTARAKGLSPARIVLVHALKNAFLPVLTTAGVSFGNLLSGSFVVETIFAVPGVGKESISSLSTRDYTLIQGTTILLATIFVVVNLITDLLYALLDPRAKAVRPDGEPA